MKTIRHLLTAAAGTALLITGAAAPASAAPTTDAAPGPVAQAAADTASEQRAVAEYWTPERMREAQPLDLVETDAADLTRVPSGSPSTVEPTAFPETGAPWTGDGDVNTTAGRVFFSFDGRDASCSGNAVTSANKSTVITAGHCVKYEGSWHTDWTFVPGYHDGQAPFGIWPATQTLTTPQWEASEDINYDVGAAVVAELDGRKLTDVTGGQGLSFNGSYDIDMYAFGYPAADPYDGETFIYCSGTSFKDFLFSDDHGLSCDMTGGSSGGPWFSSFDESTGTGLQASVNSFGYVFLPGTMFGPYFGDDAENLYETAQNS
ncbi:trypsin-like serine peptidase [Salininema proteolyticum]|uniref:Trypsin-like serine peptidase n=1 Tax=Salininema proteolyticum TaxID=1607685 RepID=A0ABV8TVJ8_9ACTN